LPFTQITEFSVEKLDPPTSCAGLTAELANVTRVYRVEQPSGTRTLLKVESVEIAWGETVAQKVSDLEAEKSEVASQAAERAAKLDKVISDLTALAVDEGK
jgi:hypothetical protein